MKTGQHESRAFQLEPEAAQQLRALGYVVRACVEANTLGRRKAHIDLVALAPNEQRELKPVFIVEVKAPRPSEYLQSALAQLQFYAPLLDVEAAYIFDGEWYRASSDFTSYTKAAPPAVSSNLEETVASPSLLSRLVEEAFDLNRDSLPVQETWGNLLAVFVGEEPRRETKVPPELLKLAAHPQNRAMIAAELAELLQKLGPMGGELSTTPKLNAAMARLLDAKDAWTVVDPFAGLGGTLRAVTLEGRTRGVSFHLKGAEINQGVSEQAGRLFSMLGIGVDIVSRNSLKEPAVELADGVVSAPPLGLRLMEPYALSSGELTRDGNLAIVDRCYSLLRSGGRAVLLLSPAFLFAAGQVQHFRQYLQEHARVSAIVELPPRLLANTAIKTTLLVLEKKAPGRTLIARLEDDWEAQLEEGGEFLKAYRVHLEGAS